MRNRYSNRKLRVELLEQRLVLAGQMWNMAADFAADFVGGLPQNNPNGVWKYLGTDGSTSSLVATNGSSPNTFGVGAGWAQASGVPSYARGGVFGFLVETMAGHGPNKIIWQAPPDVTLGGVELSGLFTQAPFEPARQMQMRIYKNDHYEPFLTVDADFEVQTTVVPLPLKRVAIAPGDILTIIVDGNGPLGNGASTFAAWNVVIEETSLEGDFNRDGAVDAADYTIWRKTLGSTTLLAADANGNGVVDPVDYVIWQGNFGDMWDPDGAPLAYHPAAVIVQTSGVTLPDGTTLDTSGSQTHGLQEAFDFSAENGWDVFVLPGTYTLDAHLDIEELQLRSFRFEDVTLNFTPDVTDFGIRFDSTMQVDWYWKGGSLNAPSATHGVLFQPHTPHPKDGPIFGTVGVIDSRFEFNIDIIAAMHQVTMNSTQAVVNDTVFSFANVTPSQIDFAGAGFTETNIFSAPRTDDPIPFDLFSTAGRVTVLPPRGQFGIVGPGSFASVFLPDGSLLDTGGSTTSGLQEAFDYAAGHALDVVVFGRGVRNANPNTSFGHYTLNSTLGWDALVERTVKIYSVTFLYPHTGGAAFTLSDVIASDLELTGEVVGYNADTVVRIRPESIGIADSVIRIQHPVGSPMVDTTVLIDPSAQTIRDSSFYFHEVNQGQFGIRIDNPSATTYFENNFLRTVHTHETNTVGVQLGQNQVNASGIRSNTLELRTAAATYPSLIALQVWGDYNFIDLVAVGSGQSFGAKFEPGSNNNTLLYGTISATSPIADFGIDNVFIAKGNGTAVDLAFAETAGNDRVFRGDSTQEIESTGRRVRQFGAHHVAEPPNPPELLLIALAEGRESHRQATATLANAAFDSETSAEHRIFDPLPSDFGFDALLTPWRGAASKSA